MNSSTIVTICSAVIALAGALTAGLLEAVWPGHGTWLSSVITIAALVAGVVINAVTKATQGNVIANAIVHDSPVVHHDGTPTGSTVVSTSSTLLPATTPAKGSGQ